MGWHWFRSICLGVLAYLALGGEVGIYAAIIVFVMYWLGWMIIVFDTDDWNPFD